MAWNVYDYVWEQNYRSAREYYLKHGNLECSPNYITDDGIKLGAWIKYLRNHCKKSENNFLSEEQIKMLDQIGMRWENKYSIRWETSYQTLCEYKKMHGNTDVPVAYTSDNGIKLGRWIRRQKELYSKNELLNSRAEKLEILGIVWNSSDSWEKKFRLAEIYAEKYGNIENMPPHYTTDGVKLYDWLCKQKKSPHKLSHEQYQKLLSIGVNLNTENKSIFPENSE